MIDLKKQTFQLMEEISKPTSEETLAWAQQSSVSPRREIVQNMYERYALSHFLMSYPEDMPFKDVLELVRLGGDDRRVHAWDIFYGCEWWELAREIECMRNTLEECFTIREEGNKP